MIYAILFIILAALPGPKSAAYTCDPDPVLASLVTPKRPGAGRYEVCTTRTAIDVVLVDQVRQGLRAGPIEALDPLDAFGTVGAYDRSKLARLFGGRRAAVVRGWSNEGEGLLSVTLVSPYPDPAFTALLPGTLVIRYVVESRGL
jgi:hypothetical protein